MESSNVKYIELGFENCESIIVPVNQINKMEFIEKSFIENYPFKGYEPYECNAFELEIKYENESDLRYNEEDYDEPLGMLAKNPMSNSTDDRPNIIGRILNHYDLVNIEFLDADKKATSTVVYVPWHEKDEYTNRYMETKTEDNLLKVRIRKTS